MPSCSMRALLFLSLLALSSAVVQRKIVSTKRAPSAIGPYSQAVKVGDTVYISGQLGADPQTAVMADGIRSQTHQTLRNMGEVLRAAGSRYENVVKTTVLLTDIANFATVNEIYKEYFKDKHPARAAYQVAALPRGALVEIEAVAIAGELEDI